MPNNEPKLIVTTSSHTCTKRNVSSSGWIKVANSKGKYQTTKKGFRIYETKESTIKKSVVMHKGELCNRTDITPGEYFAIDINGCEFKGLYFNILSKIDFEIMRRFYSKKEGFEMEFR
jgi:hypothetical protein